MGFIPEEKIGEIQHATDIVRLISEYLPLKRAGSSYKALCPFHKEKTPSFMVNPQRQIFKCFGCGEGGDVFKFIMKHERVEFVEAVRMLAQRAGIEVTEEERGGAKKFEKTRLYELNRLSADFFHKVLLNGKEAEGARRYLEGRKIGREMIERFKLGYSPAAWNGLISAAAKRGIKAEWLQMAGLAMNKEGRYYDRFRGRLMFPIFDVRGRALGFGGRALGDSDVKYINSPETPIFSKGSVLYGLSQAKDAILEGRRVVVVEGYTDVIMAHQHHLEYVVAVLGTALGREHARTLRRYADDVVLVFDSDTAGERSSDRSLDIFLEEEVPVRIATLPSGSDPCDYLLQQGREDFERKIKAAKELINYKMDLSLPSNGGRTTSEMARGIDDILATISASPNPTLKDLMVRSVAERTGVSEASLKARLSSLGRSRRGGTFEEEEASKREEPCVERAERQILQSALSMPSLAGGLQTVMDLLSNSLFRAVAERVVEVYRDKGDFTEAEVLARVADERVREAINSLVGGSMGEFEGTEEFDYEGQFEGAVKFLKRYRVQKEVEETKEKLLKAKAVGSEPEQFKWLAAYAEKKRELDRLQMT